VFEATWLSLSPETSIEAWREIGARLDFLEKGGPWWRGDWWAFGEARYGERAKAAAVSSTALQTFMNYASVARKFDTSRRREDLSFSHHDAVASLPPQDADIWLGRAAKSGWSAKRLRDEAKRGFSPGADEAPARPREADSQPGEVYELGPHRLLCGDATDAEQLARLFGDQHASMIWTDPPYGVDYVGKTADALRIPNDAQQGLRELLVGAWGAAAPVLIESAPFYVAGPTGANAEDFIASFREAGWRYQQQLVWVKNRMVLGRQSYHLQHEAVYHGHGPGATAGRWTTGRFRWYGGNNAVSVFEVDSPPASREHPTMKPVELIKPHVLNSSQPGEVVLDMFAGSGSTMIAADMCGRRAFMVELDPRYADVIRKRWADRSALERAS
jgi:DNA modification methylase